MLVQGAARIELERRLLSRVTMRLSMSHTGAVGWDYNIPAYR